MPKKESESLSNEEELAAPSVSEISETEEETTLVPSGITEERVSELLDEKLAGFTESQKEILKQLAEREVQSKHDSRYGRFESKLDEILAIKERVEGDENNWDDILAQIERQEGNATLEAALDAKIQEALTSFQPGPDEEGLKTQRKAEWESEWARAVQSIKDKITVDKLSIPAGAVEQVQSGEYATKVDAYTALNDLYIAIKTGADIPVAAAQTEGGGETPPTSDEETPPIDNYDAAMDKLQEAIRTRGAGSREAQEAKAAADELLKAAYKEHDIDFVPQATPKR